MKKLLTIIGLLTISCGTERVLLTSGTNGLDGVDGLNSLITITQLNSEQEVCQSGKGLMISAGLDLNSNGILELNEIVLDSIGVVCDGLPGEMGPQGEVGPAGNDGESIVGPQGPAGENSAILSSFILADDCQSVGDGFYAKKNGANANIYTNEVCSNGAKVASLGENADEVYMTGNLMFLVENSETMKLFKIQL